MTSVPHSVYEVARHAWITRACGNEDFNLLTKWAANRWPGTALPKHAEALAFWVISVAIQEGREP